MWIFEVRAASHMHPSPLLCKGEIFVREGGRVFSCARGVPNSKISHATDTVEKLAVAQWTKLVVSYRLNDN